MGCLCESKRSLGWPSREVTAPPSEAAAVPVGARNGTRRPPKLGHMAFIPSHRVLCSWLAVARRALIKSLPGQELKTGSNLCAFNKENRPETRKGNFRAGPGPALSLLFSSSLQGLCGFYFFLAIQVSLTLYSLVL